ncbi:MAG: hypothetical protein AVDCRST_MAG23-277, partial [uncultured Sphingosinicella sp.]
AQTLDEIASPGRAIARSRTADAGARQRARADGAQHREFGRLRRCAGRKPAR